VQVTRVFLLRHAPTPWNGIHRIQGRSDIPLAHSAVAELRRTRIPRNWLALPWFTSPLTRCVQTAHLLGKHLVTGSPQLMEMNWGDFEGLTLEQINARIVRLELDPDRGLDLCPPGGESPRMVRERLHQWLTRLPAKPAEPAVMAVTHKGVIRAALSLATGWDMMSKFPREADWRLPHCFEWQDGCLRLERLNCRWRDTGMLPR
jgi:probable phosphoglycerate mutase